MAIKIDIPEEDFARIVDSQRDWARAGAAKIEEGQPLDDIQARLAAFLLRHWAEKLPDKQRRGPGRPRKVDVPTLLLAFMHYIHSGDPIRTAYRKVARQFGLEPSGVRKAIRDDTDAHALLGLVPKPRQKPPAPK